jgi:hypothetical protein
MSNKLLGEKSLPLNIEAINSLIVYWRAKVKKASSGRERQLCEHYVDAYQTVRAVHNLPLLPLPNQSTQDQE